MDDFSILMRNIVQFSTCEAPDRPTTVAQLEQLRVSLSGNLLTIAAISASGDIIGNTLDARRTVVLEGATAFMILPELPERIADPNFFRAIGTAVVFDGPGPRRMKAIGTDTVSKDCRGWICDAVEIPT